MIEIKQYNDDYKLMSLILINEYAQEAKNTNDFSIDQKRILDVLRSCADTTLLLFNDDDIVGIIGGFISFNAMSLEPMLQEVLYYVKKEYRAYSKELYKSFEEFIRSLGIDLICIGCVHDEKYARMDKYYKRLGFKPIEHHYIKRVY